MPPGVSPPPGGSGRWGPVGTVTPRPGAGSGARGDSRLMPNLERCPHLLSTRSMTERKRQANTARATATDTWAQRGGGSGSCCGAGSLLPALGGRGGREPVGETEAGGGQGTAFIPIIFPPRLASGLAVLYGFILCSHGCPGPPHPKSQSPPCRPSPHPKGVLIHRLHGPLQRAVPGAWGGERGAG